MITSIDYTNIKKATDVLLKNHNIGVSNLHLKCFPNNTIYVNYDNRSANLLGFLF